MPPRVPPGRPRGRPRTRALADTPAYETPDAEVIDQEGDSDDDDPDWDSEELTEADI